MLTVTFVDLLTIGLVVVSVYIDYLKTMCYSDCSEKIYLGKIKIKSTVLMLTYEAVKIILILYLFSDSHTFQKSSMKSRLQWTKQEEQELRSLKFYQNIQSWDTIAHRINQKFQGKNRSSKQCRDRFINFARFSEFQANQGYWPSSDVAAIFQNYLIMGPRWAQISELFQGRSSNSVKNKFYGTLRKLARMINSDMKQKKLKHNKLLNEKSLIHILTYQNKTRMLDQEAFNLQRLILKGIESLHQNQPSVCYSDIGLTMRKFNDSKRFHAVNRGNIHLQNQKSEYRTNQFEANLQALEIKRQKFLSESREMQEQPRQEISQDEHVADRVGLSNEIHQILKLDDIQILRAQNLYDFNIEMGEIYNQWFLDEVVDY